MERYSCALWRTRQRRRAERRRASGSRRPVVGGASRTRGQHAPSAESRGDARPRGWLAAPTCIAQTRAGHPGCPATRRQRAPLLASRSARTDVGLRFVGLTSRPPARSSRTSGRAPRDRAGSRSRRKSSAHRCRRRTTRRTRHGATGGDRPPCHRSRTGRPNNGRAAHARAGCEQCMVPAAHHRY